jgi:hypothetical protein
MPLLTSEYKGNRLYRVWSGIVTDQQFLDAIDTLDKDINNGIIVKKALIDYSAVTKLDISTDAIQRHSVKSKNIAALIPELHTAIVAGTEYVFGMARMWETYASITGWTIQVFRDLESAESWLDEIPD